jgi:putative pyruvate formate lyase activating enzyme
MPTMFQPSYRRLYESGELERRAHLACSRLQECAQCPRACHVNRAGGKTGVCRTGRLAVVSTAFPHFGEESCLRGIGGSGTIFFSHCNLGCAFCQNWELSAGDEGVEVSADELAGLMLQLQARGCHNINLVTPSHVVAQILEALLIAARLGLRLPLVYNTSAYDTVDTLAMLEGVVDIYMPDFKFWNSDASARYCKAPDYPETARQAIREMHRQVGPLELDAKGVAQRGVLLRHLVMPADAAGTRKIMEWIAREISPDTFVNLMAQYHPAGRAREFQEIDRVIARSEFRRAVQDAREAGLHRFDPGTVEW